MKEVEVKILEINRSKIEKELVHLGAKRILDGEIETTFFDFPDHTLLRKRNLLRLRKENDNIELTFKKVHTNKDAKVAREYTITVSNEETAKKILKSLGLVAIEIMTKHRVSYILSNTRFDMDQYEGKYAFIPEFLEIEAESAQEIWRYAEVLGFKNDDCLPWSTKDLISYYSLRSQKVQS